MTVKIALVTETWVKNPNTKTTYILESTETETISAKSVKNMTSPDTLKFFRRLGGTEKVMRTYTCMGYMPYQMTSISPDRQTKKVRKFSYEYTEH